MTECSDATKAECCHGVLNLNVAGPKFGFYYCANCGQGFETTQFDVTSDDDEDMVTKTTEYQIIYGIFVSGRYLDYSREPLQARDLAAAKASAVTLLEAAAKPPKGKLFIRSVENWNDSGDCWYNCL